MYGLKGEEIVDVRGNIFFCWFSNFFIVIYLCFLVVSNKLGWRGRRWLVFI